MIIPKFKRGDRVRSYGFAPFVVEGINVREGVVTYDLREVLSPLLLTMTTAYLVPGVPERYVSDKGPDRSSPSRSA